jgi:hypothetical protein
MLYQGSCHCGHIAFEVEGDLQGAIECNCSICGRLGALRWFVPRSAVRSICGCAPLASGSNNGVEMMSINVRCLEGVDLAALKIKQVDGRSF